GGAFPVTKGNGRGPAGRAAPGSGGAKQAVTIDGQKLEGTPYNAGSALFLYVEKRDGRWALALPERLATDRLRQPQKTAGLTGPIDDAFTTSFLCVRGSGDGWHPATAAHAQADLERFRQEWKRSFRGELPVKDDTEVTPQDLQGRNLILFGDPASNGLIAQALPG